MKKVTLVLFVILLTGCALPSKELPVEPTELLDDESGIVFEQTENAEKFVCPIIICDGSDRCGYVAGGLENGRIINLQEDDNCKLFKLTENEEYTVFPVNGDPFTVKSKNINKQYVDAIGVYEIIVYFEDKALLMSDSLYVGIGNELKQVESMVEGSGNEGSFSMDFDGDGHSEKINISKSGEQVLITLENSRGSVELENFCVDGEYTASFDLLLIDIDKDDKKELVICLEGHDYSTEIYKITSWKYEKVLGYYMSN